MPNRARHNDDSETFDLAEHFLQYFDIVPAIGLPLKQEIYRLRYDVYCREFNYEPIENFPDGMEYDEFDSYACHVLVRHKSSGVIAGCTRLIPTKPEDPSAPLPLERYCRDSLDTEYLDSLNLPRHAISEASRLAISSQFRRRRGEQESRYGISENREYSLNELRTFPLVSVSISLATTALTEVLQRPSMLAMMEPFLPRLLRRIGYDFIKVGRYTDYHGKRAAYYVETESVLENLRPELVNLYSEIRRRLDVFSDCQDRKSHAKIRLVASNK